MNLRLPIFVAGLFWLALGTAQAIETTARAAMVVDHNTGTILFAKNENTAMPPASMSKLMTLNMVFEALEDGRLRLDEELPVSEHAMSYKGSSMYLTTRDRVKVEDLIRGVIVLSGNDACVVLAEALAGSEPEFARSMNARAKQLGMTGSTFANSNGWPHPNQRMSALDLVTLAGRLIAEFPQYYGYFAETEFAFDNRVPKNKFNRNPLLKLGIGADGLKTGHTSEAGYGVVGSATRNDRRVIIMITGLDSADARAREAEKLVNWAFRQFIQKKILDAGERVGTADVWLGKDRSVGLSVVNAVDLLLPATIGAELTAVIHSESPVEAPVLKGQPMGRLVISVDGLPDTSVDLVATDDVEPVGFWGRVGLSSSRVFGKITGIFN